MGRSMPATSLSEELAQVDENWSPRRVARFNGQEVSVARIHGEFDWHVHSDTDEVFLCISGELVLQIRYATGVEEIHLAAGDLHVVPKGVTHRPIADAPAEIVLLEKAGTVNTGD